MLEVNSTPTTVRHRFAYWAVSSIALGLLAACGGGSSAGTTPPGQIGAASTNPDGTVWFTDENAGGNATGIFIEEVYWGRLVDIYDSTGSLIHRDFVAGEDIQTDGVNYQVDVNPVTEETSLTILHPYGSTNYELAFAGVTANLGPILPKGVVNALPPFSFVPRNAAIGVRFSDLIDPNTINKSNIKLQVGNPPSLPFESRMLPDPNFGGTINGKFYSSRVIIDTTISELDASGSLLALNSLGLPASKTTALPNIGLRFPTQVNFAVGQFQILTNPSKHGVSPSNNGPVDAASQTVDVVRGMRSGGDFETTGDSNNGFLLDLNAPRLVGAQPVSILSVVPDASGDPDKFVVSLQYASSTCGVKPLDAGAVIKLPGGVFSEVTLPTAPPNFGLISDINLTLLSGNAADLHPGPAQVLTTFSSASAGLEDCFFSFSPLAGTLPAGNVSPDSQIIVRFSEPMDPGSLQPFDTFTLTRTQINPGITDFVVGEVQASSDLKEFRFVPSLPLTHSLGSTETYYIDLGAGGLGVTDLAGNAPIELPGQVSFSMSTTKASESNGGLVLRFNNPDEDGYGFNDFKGQFLQIGSTGSISPRPVERVAAIADQSQAVPGAMINFPLGVQTPMSPLGSRMMCIYRHCDVSLSLTDTTQFNMDVEGMNWAPVDGQVQADIYENFEINLSHSLRLPDEHVNTALLPTKPNSGLAVTAFAANVLIDDGVDQVTMHDQGLGYLIDPVNLFIGGSGTAFMPYPINKGKPESEWTFYTWRDTSITARGGLNSNGIPTFIESDLGIQPVGIAVGGLANQNDVPSLGLPLLMEVKCYPSDVGIGLNALACAIAINSSSLPTFRIFSTGGFDESQAPKIKNPDAQPAPTGGFNANPQLPQALGTTTPPRDNVFYYGQLDLVVRVSRVVTRWLDTADTSPDYLDPILEPRAEDQPSDTSLTVHYRGAKAITAGLAVDEDPKVNVEALNIYGEEPGLLGGQIYSASLLENPHINFLNTNRWVTDLDLADTAQYFQARFTFVSNTVSGLSPTLSAFGVAYLRNS